MPGIIPRIRALFTRGFGYLAFLMACIYNMVRILPNGHPYLNPQNIGKYGVRHVIAEAANNIVFSSKNIDQIIVFAALLAGVVIILLQFFLIFYGLVVQPAHAISYFVTPGPIAAAGPGISNTDIAYNLLDRVFGIPNLFCAGMNNQNCTLVSTIPPFPWPFHVALHGLFQFYSLGLLIVGMFIFLYYVMVVVAETAITGSPFGRRFQDVWVPIRLVVAVGLMIPLSSYDGSGFGLNSAQYIVLYSAKYGSSFATNAWIGFNRAVGSGDAAADVFSRGGVNPSGERPTLLAAPIAPDIAPVVQMMSIMEACRYAHWKLDKVRDTAPVRAPTTPVRAWFVKNPAPWMANQETWQAVGSGTSYEEGLTFFNNSDILIRFGKRSDIDFPAETGNVKPWCGEVRIHVSDLMHRAANGAVGGTDAVQEFYFNTIRDMWFAQGGSDENLARMSAYMVEIKNDAEKPEIWQCNDAILYNELPTSPINCAHAPPNSRAKQRLINEYQAELNALVFQAWETFNYSPDTGVDWQYKDEMSDRGWAGAGIWYNTIAQINGAFIDSVSTMPSTEKYPYVMEAVRAYRKGESVANSGDNVFSPKVSESKVMSDTDIKDGPMGALTIATILSDVYQYWNKDGSNQADSDKTTTGRVFVDIINVMFGTKGLIAMRGYNASVHPLAQLAALGKGLVNAAVLSIGASTIAGGIAPLAALIDRGGAFSTGLSVASGVLSGVTTIGLVAGMVLFYVVPFLPFLYFYFAVGTWIMSIFEAMVGAPLWALAHLRLDGEGLPGDSATNGYFLIFEIFLRPILSVFGLVAAMVIFTAQVRILNMIWTLIVDNLTGFEGEEAAVGFIDAARGPIDQFFFTVMYAIVVYMCAIASFKLIDRIPDNILRWMGAGVSTFSAINADPTEGLTRYAAYGGMSVGQQISGSLQQASQGIGGAAAKAVAPKSPGTP